MREIVHYLDRPAQRVACGLPTGGNIKCTEIISGITCHNCEDVLRSRNRATYWDYERAKADLTAAEENLHSHVHGISARFPYIHSEIVDDPDHIARIVRFWVPLSAHGHNSHTYNISRTATPCYIPVRVFNEGERTMIAEALAGIVERLRLRISLERTGPELSFKVKPYFHRRGEREKE